jgi:predicted  nucleic acid-binding Zn-ribbon protein
METLIFVLGILCGAVLLGIAYVIRELLRVKDEIKTLKKNKYVQEDRFSGIEDEIRKISDRIEISTTKLHEEVKERHSHLHSRIEDVKNKSWGDSDRMFQEVHRRIEKEKMEIHSIMDSRFNKMENKFIQHDLLNPASGEIKTSKR